jgi:hypothetical protein
MVYTRTMIDEIAPNIFVKVEVNTRYRVCERKHTYKNGGEARESAERSSRYTHETIVAYKCGYCSCWHIGHVKPRSDGTGHQAA